MSRPIQPEFSAPALGQSPELFPYDLDIAANSVRFIRLTEQEIARASFLDPRVLTPQTISRVLSWPLVERAVEAMLQPEIGCFIFHIGHVGSTLLSRLLGMSPKVLALREPLILRTLTQIRFGSTMQTVAWNGKELEARLGIFLKLWSRTFRPDQNACIKATSFVSELATTILARPCQPKAIFLYVRPESYLATILGGPNSRQESKILASSRLQRLRTRLGTDALPQAPLSEGEAIAMSWATEMTALTAAAESAPARVHWLDFDQFLDEPSIALTRAFDHFGVNVDRSDVMTILSGPEISRYSKAPEHAYDTQLRRDILDLARRNHAEEIMRGLAWLDQAEVRFPVVQRALAAGR